MAVSEEPRQRDRPHAMTTSGPVLRQITVRSAAHAQSKGRHRGALGAVTVVVALLVGAAAGLFGGHAWWKPSVASTVKATQAALNDETAPLFLHAYAQQKAGDISEAQKEYLSIIAINPVNYYAYYDLGLIYQDTNHPAPATVDYEKALLVDPTFQPALYNLAVLETSSDPTSAIDLYQQLQALHPHNADAVAFNLGLLYIQTGHQSAGVAELKYALTLDPALASRLPSTDQKLVATSASGSTKTG